MELAIIGVLAVLVIFIILYYRARSELRELRAAHEGLVPDHQGGLVKHGLSFEQLFPFMKKYPYDPRNFRFIGDPVDGLSFEDDRVVFVEFKTGKSRLSYGQKRVRDLVEGKKVEWREVRE